MNFKVVVGTLVQLFVFDHKRFFIYFKKYFYFLLFTFLRIEGMIYNVQRRLKIYIDLFFGCIRHFNFEFWYKWLCIFTGNIA